MLRIRCPWCGERDEIEFRYRGDASRIRPASDARVEAFTRYVYERDNPRGWHLEWWLHAGGCRKLLKVERHTLSHEIRSVLGPEDETPSVLGPEDQLRSVLGPEDETPSVLEPEDQLSSVLQPEDELRSVLEPEDEIRSVPGPENESSPPGGAER